jgi:anti-sigma factor RsiW
MKGKTPRDRCLSDDEVAAYVDGAVKRDLRKRIEEHLAQCSTCLHSVVELKHLVSAAHAQEKLPAAALARAESIVERTRSRASETLPELDIVLALKSGICKILETTGEVLRPGRLAPVTVRGERRTAPSPRVAQSLSAHLVTLELVSAKQGVEPRLTIVEEASAERPDGIKAKLRGPDASDTKYSRAGKIGFSPVGPGTYRIEIEKIGRIRLDIQ